MVRRYFPEVDPHLMWVSLRDGDELYLHSSLDKENWGIAVFDLESDPDQNADLYRTGDTKQKRLVADLSAYKRSLVEAYDGEILRASEHAQPDADELRLLKSLGYVR